VQPWPGEVLEERAGEIAAGFASMLLRSAAWRHRRVETITVLSHEIVRRSVSVDFTVPLEHRDELRLSETEWIVPLALVSKRPLVHFHLCREDRAAVPLLRLDESRLIAHELLYTMLDLDTEAAVVDDVAPLIEWILAARPDEAGAVGEAVDELQAQLGPLPGFAVAAEWLASGFLLCAVLNDVTRRRVIKFAYDEPLARPGRWAHFYDAPGCTEAASYHAEVEVPDELRARTTRLVDNRTGAILATGPRDADRPSVYYVADPGVRLQPGLSVRYATERGRFLVPAMLVAWAIALGLALPWLFADLDTLATSGGPAIAVLLSTSAVFSGLVLRSGEHPLVRLVLAPYRSCLVAATAAAIAGGGTLAFRASAGTLAWTWGLGALVAVLSASILTAEAARAPAATRDR
jgi:hypothetical protein